MATNFTVFSFFFFFFGGGGAVLIIVIVEWIPQDPILVVKAPTLPFKVFACVQSLVFSALYEPLYKFLEESQANGRQHKRRLGLGLIGFRV